MRRRSGLDKLLAAGMTAGVLWVLALPLQGLAQGPNRAAMAARSPCIPATAPLPRFIAGAEREARDRSRCYSLLPRAKV